MTIAIKVNPNAYAIGPSLHEAAFEKEFEWWRINHYGDRQRPRDKAEIAEVMSEALSNLYGNDKDSAAFDQALFAWYCSKDNMEATKALHGLLDKHIRAAVRKEWNREQQKAA